MPTEKISSVGTGKDYTTLALWESDFGAAGGVTSSDLITNDEIAVAELYGASTAVCKIKTWTGVDQTNHCAIRAASGEKYVHAATPSGASHIYAGDYGLECWEDTVVEDLGFGSLSYNYSIYISSGTNLVINRCTLFGKKFALSTGTNVTMGSSLLEINDSLGGSAALLRYATCNNVTMIINSAEGIGMRDCACENVLIYNADATTTYANFYNCTGNYNAQSVSDKAAPPGANSIDDVPSTDFLNYAGGDYHLSGTDADVYHAGTPSETLDHDNVSFDVSTPSIGAFEYVAAGGGGGPTAGTLSLLGVGI